MLTISRLYELLITISISRHCLFKYLLIVFLSTIPTLLQFDKDREGSCTRVTTLPAVLRIRIRMFSGLLDPDPDPVVPGTDPDPDSDPSIIKQKW
jgi:hypothetical protein